MKKHRGHTFHIPVMGTSFTIDTPVKVAHLGISSVISIVDDGLIEKMRQYYCGKLNLPFKAITDKMEDFRARRITEYLNLVDRIVRDKFNRLKRSTLEKSSELRKYFDLLPDDSQLKEEFVSLKKTPDFRERFQSWLQKNLVSGSIDVNIMTKVDKVNYDDKKEQLPLEFNDAHAALRGYARSSLCSSIIFSAGMNPRLYGYMEKFEDFFPDPIGRFKKKIVIKVSDYRSAAIQGKFLARKGLWVSEYRIESGLNCGGHAFASDGYLMGPILEEFKKNRDSLLENTWKTYMQALSRKGRIIPASPPELKITAQGGVGTAEEHRFLLNYYELDSVGWGSPFLLVPEAVIVDDHTRHQLAQATEDDLYLSNISPLGVPFNSLRNNTKDLEKEELIRKGRPGSPCPKRYLVSNKEFTATAICTASRQYQHLKLKELEDIPQNTDQFSEKFREITAKACLCVGLSAPALRVTGMGIERDKKGVSVCPGPNLAYFSRLVSLKEMIDHIYGRLDILSNSQRPHMFIKELELYVNYLKSKVREAQDSLTEKQVTYFRAFHENLRSGMEYYREMIKNAGSFFQDVKSDMIRELEETEDRLNEILESLVEKKSPQPV